MNFKFNYFSIRFGPHLLKWFLRIEGLLIARSLIADSISRLNLFAPIMFELEYFLASCLRAIRTIHEFFTTGYSAITLVLDIHYVADLLPLVGRLKTLLSLLFHAEKTPKHVIAHNISTAVFTLDCCLVSLRLDDQICGSIPHPIGKCLHFGVPILECLLLTYIHIIVS